MNTNTTITDSNGQPIEIKVPQPEYIINNIMYRYYWSTSFFLPTSMILLRIFHKFFQSCITIRAMKIYIEYLFYSSSFN